MTGNGEGSLVAKVQGQVDPDLRCATGQVDDDDGLSLL
jgi:hypothetical protein